MGRTGRIQMVRYGAQAKEEYFIRCVEGRSTDEL